MTSTRSKQDYMRSSLELATQALEFGEFPIAAIIVLDGRIIASGSATEVRQKRYLGHAELLALEDADRLGLSLEQRRAARLFTTLEPCLMCMGAAMSFFLGEIHYALESPGDGAVSLVKAWERRQADIHFGLHVTRQTGGNARHRESAEENRHPNRLLVDRRHFLYSLLECSRLSQNE